jgi:iron complex transport system ATP-binding protein
VSAISVQSLTFRYGATHVLHDVSVEIQERKFTAILGRNGSGKSTLMRILAGLLPYQNGTVLLMGNDMKSLSPRSCADLVGFLPQFHKPVFPFSVTDVVMTGRARFIGLLPSKTDHHAVGMALERVGASHLALRPYTDLSGGEQQLVLIARLLAQNPKILLLDEPTSHLDIGNQSKLFGLLRSFVNDGLTVCAVLHDPSSAFLYADEFLFTGRKSVCCVSEGRSSCDTAFLKEIFDTDLDIIQHKGYPVVVPRI